MHESQWAQATKVLMSEAAHNTAVVKLRLLPSTCVDSAFASVAVFHVHLEVAG